MTFSGAFACWCAWGFVGCGMLPAWRQGWRGLTVVIAGVLASFAILFSAALLLQFVAVPLTRSAWLGATMVLSLAGCLLPNGKPVEPKPGNTTAPPDRWLVLALAFATGLALTLIVYRAVWQPLTGPDTIFRWDFLARQIVREGGFGFYPASGAEDFARFMWPEGIPPLLALLYAWGYLGAGSTAASFTAPVVVLVATLDFVLVWMLANRIAGRTAAAWALAILAGSAVHTWSVSMGQETGLTTLGLLALAWAMGGQKAEPDWRAAALAASVTALSRDYGMVLILAGAGWLAWRRRPWVELGAFLAVAVVLVLPWYLRVWARTGNPLYNFDLFGCFPINAMQHGLMESFVTRYGFGDHGRERVAEFGSALWPLGAGLLLIVVASMRMREAWPFSVRWLAGLWLALWIWSVGYTAGGLLYSTRVLSPVLAVAAVAGGVALARIPAKWHGWLAAGLIVLAAEASVRALVMMRTPLAIPVHAWHRIGDRVSAQRGDEAYDRAATLLRGCRVMVDEAYAHAFLVSRGVNAVPVWSPELDFLRTTRADMPAAMRRLRAAGVDFVCLTMVRDQREYYDRYFFFQEVGPWLRPVLDQGNWVLFALEDSPGQIGGNGR